MTFVPGGRIAVRCYERQGASFRTHKGLSVVAWSVFKEHGTVVGGCREGTRGAVSLVVVVARGPA